MKTAYGFGQSLNEKLEEDGGIEEQGSQDQGNSPLQSRQGKMEKPKEGPDQNIFFRWRSEQSPSTKFVEQRHITKRDTGKYAAKE